MNVFEWVVPFPESVVAFEFAMISGKAAERFADDLAYCCLVRFWLQSKYIISSQSGFSFNLLDHLIFLKCRISNDLSTNKYF